MSTKKTKILGIDPGLTTIGFGLIEVFERNIKLLDYGIISTEKGEPMEKRLLKIFNETDSLLLKLKPNMVGIEDLFFYKNQKTAMIVGQARGAILVACAKNNKKILHLTPLQIKLNITGYGRATKQQMKKMVEQELKYSDKIKSDDTIDAIATALCAYFITRQNNRQ